MKTEDVALFHRIVETGSLVLAADLLNLPKSTISRRLQGLEEEIGVKLFHRQSRSMTLTSAGSHFYEKTLSILADLEQTLAEITDKEAELSGHLRISLFPIPELIAIVDSIFEFMDLHPQLTVELITTTEPLDMIRHNIDIAFMVDEAFNDLDMVARPVTSEFLCFVASPNYLAKAGMPATPEELAEHNSILFRFPNGKIFNELPFGKDMTITVNGNICMNSVELAYEAALVDRGVAYLPISLCEEAIDEGRLVQLFEDIEPYNGMCNLVYPSRRFVSLASRRLIDHMMELLTEDGKPKKQPIGKRRTWY